MTCKKLWLFQPLSIVRNLARREHGDQWVEKCLGLIWPNILIRTSYMHPDYLAPRDPEAYEINTSFKFLARVQDIACTGSDKVKKSSFVGSDYVTVAHVRDIRSDKRLHPKTQLPTASAGSDPVLRRVKSRDSRHSRDALAAELRKLLAFGCIYINKTIHVAYAEALDTI